MPKRRGLWQTMKEWWMLIAVTCLTAGITVLFALLIPALSRISDQAELGRSAKARQCAVFPISAKVYSAAWVRGEISEKELAVITKRPSLCPPPNTP